MRATSARCPAAIDIHSGNDRASETSRRRGWRMTASPWRTFRRSRRPRGELRRQDALEAQRQPAEPLGMPGQHEEHRRGRRRRRGRRQAADLDPRTAPGRRRRRRADGSTNTPNSSSTVDEVEQPFEDDGRERRGRLRPRAGPAGTGGSPRRPAPAAGARGKADHRGRGRRDENASARSAPADTASAAPAALRQHRHDDAERRAARPSARRSRPRPPQVGVQKKRQQPEVSRKIRTARTGAA